MRAAVDADLRTGDERTVLGAEHGDDAGDGLRAAKPWPRAGASLVKRDQSVSSGRPGPVPVVIPLSMEPGATLTKRRPCLLYSAASACVMDWMPPLLAA